MIDPIEFPLKVYEVGELIKSFTYKQFKVFINWSKDDRMDFLRRLAKARRDKKVEPVISQIKRLAK